MRNSGVRKLGRVAGSAALAWIVGMSHASGQTESGEPATWTSKETRFVYQGFTARYSCDGLRDEMRNILLQLGARKDDLKVTEMPCSSNPGRPDPFPGVHIKMSVLQPASGNGGNVPTHWKTVDLSSRGPGIEQSGQCELLEQVKRSILPLFSTRNVDYSGNCVPHQLQIGATRLRLEVLMPDRVTTQGPRAPQ